MEERLRVSPPPIVPSPNVVVWFPFCPALVRGRLPVGAWHGVEVDMPPSDLRIDACVRRGHRPIQGEWQMHSGEGWRATGPAPIGRPTPAHVSGRSMHEGMRQTDVDLSQREANLPRNQLVSGWKVGGHAAEMVAQTCGRQGQLIAGTVKDLDDLVAIQKRRGV